MSKLVSMRLDDDVVKIIESVEGKNFTEKFHNFCRFEHDHYIRLSNDVNWFKKQRSSLLDDINKYRSVVRRLSYLSGKIEDLIIYVED